MRNDAPGIQAEPPDRRSFLRSTALAAPAALLGASVLTSGRAQAAGKTKTKSNSNSGGGFQYPEGFSGQNSRFFKEIQADENAHVQFLVKALGAMARPAPTFQGLQASSVVQFVQMSNMFENTGVGAYSGAGPYIHNMSIAHNALTLLSVEAYHSGWLNTIVNNPLVPDASPFGPSFDQNQVVTAVTPFIASLNGGPMPGYSLTPSDANDIEILNFALLLEYLEAEFYNMNVPTFFP